ncbi:MAG: TonB-dependent receptor [Gammaproteobacteria bacterium]|nr:TonB-dependent receptor [Gammaproteobacteria bacterium]
MSKRLFLSTVSVLLIAFGSITTAFAQGSTGLVSGQVVDAAGSGVAGVSITVSDANTGLERTVTTNSGGNFRMQLPPGTYALNSSKIGYGSVTIEEVRVNLGATAELRIPVQEAAIEEITTYGSATSLISTGTAESALNISLDEVSEMPVPRNIEAVALLAPDTIVGDNSFGVDFTLVSFGGASVAENTYFIDGLNVTNFRNGLGGSSVPFEFYDQFQIKSGGYSAEFGRSIGGVMNAITKRGSNEFHYGVVSYFEPGGMSTSPNTRYADGTYYDWNEENDFSSTTFDIYVSGPIIKDKLFFYLLAEPQSKESEFTSLDSIDNFNKRETDDSFWGGNLTWNITNDHALSVTAFSDERERFTQTFNYDQETNTVGDEIGFASDFRGGDNLIVRYDGQITDSFMVSALYGKNEYSLTSNNSNGLRCPLVVDARPDRPGSSTPGCWVAFDDSVGDDEREAIRLDFEWYVGNHTIRAGIDNETNTSFGAQTYTGLDVYTPEPGGIYYRYETYAVGAQLANGALVPDVNGDGSDVDTVRVRYFQNGGNFETTSAAYYLEDVWDISDSLTLSIGIRNETFENLNSRDEVFIKVTDQWAPRFGISWSPTGTDESRLFANWGRYHIPIPSNTNVRLSGAELDYRNYYVFDGNIDAETGAPVAIGADGVPTTQEIGARSYNSDGEVPDTRTVLDLDLEPMFQDEYIIGYEQRIGENWIGGLRYVSRDLSSTIDDILTPCDHYILTNPGTTARTYDECNPSGEIQEVIYTPEELGFPKAEREYKAIELSMEKVWADDWRFKGTYTWSRNKGNTEGFVKSDIGQDDAGITQDFDIPQLMDGAYGFLPNDRRHKIKMFGSRAVTDRLVIGATITAQSGRPVNAFGVGHPDGTPDYGDTYYLTTDLGDPDVEGDESFQFIPRGTFGRTDWVWNVNMSAIYSFNLGDRADVELRAEVFNLFNADATTEVYEFAENSPSIPDERFGLSQYYQTPRYVRFGASLRF